MMEYDIILLVVIGGLFAFIGFQYRVISNLTDRVMAKDYAEYKALNKPSEQVKDEQKRKPMSWADDMEFSEDEIQQ
ncbi:hypothetical protein D3C71_1963620 [compost metagenome]